MKTPVILVVAFLTYVGNAATFKGFVGFGSVSNAIVQYALPNSIGLDIGVYQDTWDGPKDVSHSLAFNLKPRFTTIEALNSFFRQQATKIAQGALTNSEIDKDLPLHIFAVASGGTGNLGVLYYLACSAQFNLGKSVIDGSYYVPSFDGFEMALVNTMIYEILTLEWARIEVRYNPAKFTNSDSAGIIFSEDPRFDPPDKISIGEHYIEIPTKFATAGQDGDTLIKVTTVTHEGTNHNFQVYGPTGTPIPETPIITFGMQVDTSHTSFHIDGGDAGRILAIQGSSSIAGPWIDISTKFVVPVGDYPPMFFSEESPGSIGFYRVRTVNESPYQSPF